MLKHWFSYMAVVIATDVFAQAETQSMQRPWWTNGNNNTVPATNFIGTTNTQDFVIRTDNVERARVLSGGNVGIGVAAPSQLLHVAGNFRLDNAFMPGNNAGTAGQILTSGGAGVAPVWKSFSSYALVANDNLPDNFVGSCGVFGTFSNTTSQGIPDVSTINVSIPVSGVTGTVCKVTVTLNINHTWDSDLDVFLIGPGGQIAELTTDNGGLGDNYTGTVFDDAAATSITTGTAPFTGTYQPETPLSVFNGVNPNGNWTLQITDDLSGDVGTFISAIITIHTAASGTFTFVGEVAVPIVANETVVINANYSIKTNSTSGVAIRVTRDAVTGAGSVGTVIGYCADNNTAGNYSACGISDRDAGLAAGTYYYKLWEFAPSSVASTRNYSLVVHKQTN